MSDGEGVERLLGAGQRTTQRVDERDERTEAHRHERDLLLRRCAEVAFLALWVPLFVGPRVLVVYVTVAFGKGVPIVARWLGYDDLDEVNPWSLIAIAATVYLAFAFLPDAALFWWPYRWQASRETMWGLLWPMRWPVWIPFVALIRFILVYAPWRAWRLEETHLTNRQRREVEVPTASGAAYNSADLHLVEIDGTHNPHRDPEAPPIVQIQPTRITPLRVAPNARPVRTIELPFGGAVEVDRLVAMLESDEGFSWRTWRRHGWTRGEWETACQILVHSGIISEPQSGKTTARLVSVDEAVERIEDMG